MSTVSTCEKCHKKVGKDQVWKTDNGLIHTDCGGRVIVELRVSIGERLGNWSDRLGKPPQK